MKACGRHFCKYCGEEMIHRDHRRIYESSSAIGQIVHREGPVAISVSDIDMVVMKMVGNQLILKIIEQKNPSHSLGQPQHSILTALAEMISHCIKCNDFKHQIHQDSGVYVIYGDVGANEQKVTQFLGPQTMIKHNEIGGATVFHTHEEFFRFLDPYNSRRRQRR